MASPLDSTYASGVARLLYQTKRQRDDLDEQDRQDQTDFDTQLQRMARARATSLQNQNHQANREGLFYSGQLSKRRGNVERDYAEQQQDQQTQLDRRHTARTKAMQDLGSVVADPNSPLGFRATGGAAFDLQDMYNDAVQRRLQADQGISVPDGGLTPAGAPAAAAATSSARGPFVGKIKNGKFYHVYNGGQSAADWVYIRPATH